MRCGRELTFRVKLSAVCHPCRPYTVGGAAPAGQRQGVGKQICLLTPPDPASNTCDPASTEPTIATVSNTQPYNQGLSKKKEVFRIKKLINYALVDFADRVKI